MNGSPAKLGTIQGTAGHRSALKFSTAGIDYLKDKIESAKSETDKKVETKTSKDKDKKVWIKKGGSMKHKMKDLKAGSKERYEEYERRGWAHDKTTKGYKPTKTSTSGDYGPDAKDKGYAKFMEKHGDITDKADKRSAEVKEDTNEALSRLVMKTQKDTHGKKSKKYLQAKMQYLKDREADRQGELGGGKQWGIFRGISSWGNKRKQARTQKKLDEIAGKEAREKANEGKASALTYKKKKKK